MKIARLTMGGIAAAIGVCALSAPGFAQEYYVRTAEPMGGPVIMQDPGPGYVVEAPRERVIIREAPVVIRQAPQRVIVQEPMGGPYANEVYVREPAPLPAPLPPREVRNGFYDDGGCQPVQRETRSGFVTVGMACN